MSESPGVEIVLQRLTADGAVAKEVVLEQGGFGIGRVGDGFPCPDDSAMADHHARIQLNQGKVVVGDSGEGSGVWLRIQGLEGRLLQGRDQIWLGGQILVMDHKGAEWKIRHHGPDGRLLKSYGVPVAGLLIGRKSDLVLDAEDARLSRRHAQLVPEGGELRLYDRGARNGTYLKLTTDEELADGDEFRLSANLFRLVARGGLDAGDGSQTSVELEPEAQSEAQREKRRGSPGLAAHLRSLGHGVAIGPDVSSGPNASSADPTPDGVGQEADSSPEAEQCLLVLDSDSGSISLEISAGQTVLEAVIEAGLERGDPVDWECGDGGCGVCVMGVVEGADRLDPADPATGEMRTIQITEQVVPDPRKYRLACLARVRGTVRLRKLT